ncbi:DgyrCDS10687 [Dimorphilus gyrociliatus]|uniref:DgyrCDS10687 n=1 Tax=Dimorphilus gyrociliatus TaxID=2664684 RepID=A0A7I8W256_9ANNE|nr:DgyrCDS10687 [Dimorphilus gyrociliatus]
MKNLKRIEPPNFAKFLRQPPPKPPWLNSSISMKCNASMTRYNYPTEANNKDYVQTTIDPSQRMSTIDFTYIEKSTAINQETTAKSLDLIENTGDEETELTSTKSSSHNNLQPIKSNHQPQLASPKRYVANGLRKHLEDGCQPAFYVYNETTGTHHAEEKLNWEKVGINNGNLFNSSLNEAIVDKNGYYISSVCIATVAQSIGYVAHDGSFGGDRIAVDGRLITGTATASRVSVARISSSQKVHIKAFQNTSITFADSSSKATSWLMFYYKTENVFYGRYTGMDRNSYLLFHDIVANQNIGYFGKTIRITEKGLYFISISIDIEKGPSSKVNLFRNRNEYSNGQVGFGSASGSVYTKILSKSWIIYLDKNDEISFKGNGNRPILKEHSSLALFQIEKDSALPAMNRFSNEVTDTKFLDFPVRDAEIGNHWNSRDHAYEVWTEGVYFLTLTVDAQPSSRLSIDIMINETIAGKLFHGSRSFSGTHAVTKTMLLRLEKGDKLQFVIDSGLTRNTRLFYTGFTIFYANIRENGYYISAVTSSTTTSKTLSLEHVGAFGGDRIDVNGTFNEGVSMTSRISVAKVTSNRDVFLTTRGNNSIAYSDGSSKALSWAMFRYPTNNIFYGRYTGMNSRRVIFNDVQALEGIGYDTLTPRIIEDGVYFISISIGIEKYETSYEVTLTISNSQNTGFSSKILFGYSKQSSNSQVVSKSWVLELKKNDRISVSSSNAVGSKLLGSLTVFKIDADIERPAFSAYSLYRWRGAMELDAIPFKNIYYQIGNFWNNADNTYEVWASGIYFLSLSAGSSISEKLEIDILVNRKSQGLFLTYENRMNWSGSTLTHSRTMLIKLNKGDILQFLVTRNSALQNTFDVTSFSLFYLSKT